MDKFEIVGGRPLRGVLAANGSKNAALPILIASLLTDEACEFTRVPALRDIRTTLRLLETLGKKVDHDGRRVTISASKAIKDRADYHLVKQMRASILVAGPLLARLKRARVPIPGGCAIGLRPIDLHLSGFERLGARASYSQGDVLLSAASLHPARIPLSFPSVGATENLMMAAAAVEGTTTIENAAREPEIDALGEFLRLMGAEVSGTGTRTVRIRGRAVLRGARYEIPADRIESGTFLIAAAATRGDLLLEKARPSDLKAVIDALKRAGAKILVDGTSIHLRMAGRPRAASIKTSPHPGFPTDLQPPWMALMSLARGKSLVRETIFEKRMLHAAELARMGAQIHVDGEKAQVDGVAALNGAPVMASDLRAGAALVVAALAAKGETVIDRVYHIDRGYERLEARLRSLGARIRRTAS